MVEDVTDPLVSAVLLHAVTAATATAAAVNLIPFNSSRRTSISRSHNRRQFRATFLQPGAQPNVGRHSQEQPKIAGVPGGAAIFSQLSVAAYICGKEIIAGVAGEDGAMRKAGAIVAAALLSLLVVVGCGLQPTPPPQFDMVDFGGTGDLMTKCMQYASQSYCERQIWGGDGGFR